MTIDWKSPETYDRLLGAICAATGGKMDYKLIAFYYGQGATYNSIEGRFRIAKKVGFKLVDEAEREGRNMPVPISKMGINSPRKLSTPKKSGQMSEGVLGGRVSKNNTPSKRTPAKIKQELFEEEFGTQDLCSFADDEQESNFAAAMMDTEMSYLLDDGTV